jgi:hypothetical protein
VAPPPRALALIAVLVALTACGTKPGPPDPAVAVGTGIPMGAPKATGVDFEASSSRVTPTDHAHPEDGPIPLPTALPPDPFDPPDVPEPKEHAGSPAGPKGPKPAMKGTQL